MTHHEQPDANENAPLTTAAGAPVVDNQNSITVGPRGPVLMQDLWLIEKLAHFAREVIPERRMHANGSGAFGTFTVTNDISRYTRAALFDRVGNSCEVVARFSTVAGERGAADAERDIRGFAVRFFTTQGNWDVVGNNTPVFFFRDPENNWGFWTGLPESLHQVTITMSERGIPRSYRHRHGYGSHTFSLISAAGERHIERGNHPRWTLYIQVMPEAEAAAYRFHPFDLTKVWSQRDYPLIEVGVLELNRNPENYFADIEQAAFTPANLVPGISYSPDRMLQGRLFSYGDAARYRVGVNHHQIPVNQPRAASTVNSYHRDGAMRVDGNQGRIPGIEPNSYGRWADQPGYAEPAMPVGSTADHFDFRDDDQDYFTQPGDLFRLMKPAQRQALFDNTARAISGALPATVERHIEHCTKADPDYGDGVRRACQAIGAI
jgi:catalase